MEELVREDRLVPVGTEARERVALEERHDEGHLVRPVDDRGRQEKIHRAPKTHRGAKLVGVHIETGRSSRLGIAGGPERRGEIREAPARKDSV